MPNTNGHGPKRAVLYARVSTDEQARSGYSLAQQLESLREYAAREGYEVLEEVQDAGQSGASLERPGMDRVRDLVAAGGVFVVLAQDRDRFAREPAYHYLLRREFEEYGTKIRALNDRGDESPEGELTDGILDQLAKFERAKIAERTRRGKVRKAKEGKIVPASSGPTFGFAFNEARDGFVIHEPQMRVVRAIFRMIAEERFPITTVRCTLEERGVPAPGGGRRWFRSTIRKIVQNDCYRPHTHQEVARLVAPEVALRLGPEGRYGVNWWGRRKVTQKQVAENGSDGIKRYRKSYNTLHRPREEWIAIPVPDSGIPVEVVDRARAVLEDNPKPSAAGGRFWELSGGVFICGGCGHRMQSDRKRRSTTADRFHHYYKCPNRRPRPGVVGRCPGSRKSHKAEEAEALVWDFVSGLLKDPTRLKAGLEKKIEAERLKVARGDPDREARAWLGQREEIEAKRSRFQDMAAEGLLTFEELGAKLCSLEEAREVAEEELGRLRARSERLEALERDSDALLASLQGVVPQMLDELPPEDRNRIYKMLSLKVEAIPGGPLQLSGSFAREAGVCTSGTIGCWGPTPTCLPPTPPYCPAGQPISLTWA
jgi:site-specific DNA recombinase